MGQTRGAEQRITSSGFPPGLGNLEYWENWNSPGIFNRLEKSEKITQNTGKVGEFQIYIIYYF